MRLKIVIADDERLARQKLRQLLDEEDQVQVVGESANAYETMDLVRFTCPNLLLLDIQMPELDGFGVISALSAEGDVAMPRIIFTTAYDRYALRAFEINAIDYLLKPFTRERSPKLCIAHGNNCGPPRQLLLLPGDHRPKIIFKLVLSLSREAGSCSCLSPISTGFAPKKTMSVSALGATTTSCAKPWRTLKPDSIPVISCVRPFRDCEPPTCKRNPLRLSGGRVLCPDEGGERVPLSRGYRSRISHLLSSQVGN